MNDVPLSIRKNIADKISANIKDHLDNSFRPDDDCDRSCIAFDIYDMLDNLGLIVIPENMT